MSDAASKARTLARLMSETVRLAPPAAVRDRLRIAGDLPVPAALAAPADDASLAALLRRAATLNVALFTPQHLRVEGLPRAAVEAGVALTLDERPRRIDPRPDDWIVACSGSYVVSDVLTALRPVRGELAAPLPVDADVAEFLSRFGNRAAASYIEAPLERAIAVAGVLADGTPVGSVNAPRSAVGPDLDHLLLGTGDTLGVITGVTLRARPVPTALLARAATLRAGHGFDTLIALARLGPRLDELTLTLDGDAAVIEFAVAGSSDRADVIMQEAQVLLAASGASIAPLARAAPLAEKYSEAAFLGGGLYDAVRELLDGPLAELLARGARVTLGEATAEGCAVAATGTLTASNVEALARAARQAGVRVAACEVLSRSRDAAGLLYGTAGPLYAALKQRLDPAGVLNPGVPGFDARRPV